MLQIAIYHVDLVQEIDIQGCPTVHAHALTVNMHFYSEIQAINVEMQIVGSAHFNRVFVLESQPGQISHVFKTHDLKHLIIALLVLFESVFLDLSCQFFWGCLGLILYRDFRNYI